MGPGTVGAFGVFIPIIGMLIGGFVVFSKSEIGRAFASRLRGQVEPNTETLLELDALRREVEGVRGDLVEMQERLDFTERLLARQSTERTGSSVQPSH